MMSQAEYPLRIMLWQGKKKYLYGEIAVRFELPVDKVEQFVNETVREYLEEF